MASQQETGSRASVREFFKGKSIFMTGATGFVGRFLVYKFLKDTDIKNIYFLLREKKGQSIQERYETFTNLELFSYLPDKEVLKKIVPLQGDITLPACGLSTEDMSTITEKVDIVFHSAATVKFNEPLKSATKLHVYGTENMIQLAKKITNLDVFIHVSSIGAWCAEDTLLESIIDPPVNPRAFVDKMEAMSVEEAAVAEKDYIGKWPKYMNTYCFTKTLAEAVVNKERDNMTVGVIRPPFLYSSMREPEMGWFDTPQTGAGLGALFSLGLARMADLRLDDPVECIPVDLCVNALITCCWYMGTVAKERKEKLKVFNMSSSRDYPITGRELMTMGIECGYKFPSTKQIRPPVEAYHHVPSRAYIKMKAFFTQTLFAYLIDFLLIITGQKPMLVRLTRKILGAVSQIFETICHYKQELKVEMGNLDMITETDESLLTEEDREIFFYNLKTIAWRKMGEANHMRFRRVILKEPDSNLPYARKRLKVIEVGYKMFKIGVWAGIGAVCYGIHLLLSFSPFLSLVYYGILAVIAAIFILQ